MSSGESSHAEKGVNATSLAAHLACVHLTQLERQRRAGSLQVEFVPDPRLEAMRERGREHEAAYVEALRAQGRDVCDLRSGRDPAATVEAMKRGYGAIVQAPLQSATLFGIADVLLRVDKTSSLGPYSYEPVETKLARETRAGTILQLCTYAEILTTIQGVQPEYLHVVTPLLEEHYRTEQFSAYFRLVRKQFQNAVAAEPPPQTYPDPVAHCDICAYWKYCDSHRRTDDHPSLIADIRLLQVREFQTQGLSTLAAIARTEGKLPAEPSRGHVATFSRLGHQARLQLAARGLSVPPIELLPEEAGRGLARLLTPSPSDIFLDFEGDPFAGEHGLEYLTGYCTRDASGATTFAQLWAFDPADERNACEQFIDFAIERLRADSGMHIYHFGSYEPSALKRLCARYDTRGEEMDQLLRGQRFIDLHSVVREAMRVGVERYGLKELELLHGFRRSTDLREAGIARRDLELALECGHSRAVPPEVLESVSAYNRDDCLSTESLRGWLERQRADLLERGRRIERPETQPLEASPEVSERDKRIAELKRALTDGIPDQIDQRTEEQHGRVLLASMLSYFRQEEKNAWWEHFRLRELPVGEQLDEREMLGGLRFVETMPKVGKERNSRCRFSFPPQDTAIAAEDAVYFTQAEDPASDKTTSLTVAAIDLVAGSVVFSMNKAAEARPPTAVFRQQVVGAKPLEKSLLDFAESVASRGFDRRGRYAAVSALLLRRKPLAEADVQQLRRPEENLGQATERLCGGLDFDALPIQGPPGSGKTRTGAHAILALSMAGKKVGITAVSHKVIGNLLDAIRRAAEQDPAKPEIRLVHKDDGDDPVAGVEYVENTADAVAAISGRTVVGGTAWLWADDRAAEQLDYLFIDEAGQMALAQALAAGRSAQNIVLLGDPQQLEQPRKGAHPDGADVAALVHLLGKGRVTLADDQGLFLDSTYRLHPAICGFTSELYYENRLVPVTGLELQRLEGETPFSGSGLFLVEVQHEGNQAQADEEVRVVAGIVQSILRPDVHWTDRFGKARPITANDVLVVAPYNAQVGALTRALRQYGVSRVGTVDKFQGQEAPIVIYSCTSSSAQDAPRGMPFLYDPHRFNVATSRAQGIVIVVASPRLFEPDCRTPEQMLWANGLCRYRELAKILLGPKEGG